MDHAEDGDVGDVAGDTDQLGAEDTGHTTGTHTTRLTTLTTIIPITHTTTGKLRQK